MQSAVIPDKAFINAIYTHRLENLVALAGLEPTFAGDSEMNPNLAQNWVIAVKWNEQSRYEFWDLQSATSLLEAISDSKN